LNASDSVFLGKTKFLFFPAEHEDVEQTIVLHSLAPEADWKLDHERLKLIYKITTELSENQDLSVLGKKIFLRLKEIFNQDRSYLALFDQDGTLKPVSIDPSTGSIPLSRNIVNRLFKSGEAFVLQDALNEASLKNQESIVGLNIRSALCAPFIFRNQIYGLIYLDCNTPWAYTENDLALLRTVALMLSPLIENARLWSELRGHYDRALEDLRATEERLIEMERSAAYVRLAQAMAHEIRNPLMAMGGLLRRVIKPRPDHPEDKPHEYIMSMMERIETVLKEVDSFVSLPEPQMHLVRIDHLVQEVFESHSGALLKNGPRFHFSVNTPHLKIPLDPGLFKKALSMVIKEIALNVHRESEFEIILQHSANNVEIIIGNIDSNKQLYELFDPAMQNKPWTLGLFLNIAHKIISSHRGKLLLDAESQSPVPLIIRMPRTIKA